MNLRLWYDAVQFMVAEEPRIVQEEQERKPCEKLLVRIDDWSTTPEQWIVNEKVWRELYLKRLWLTFWPIFPIAPSLSTNH